MSDIDYARMHRQATRWARALMVGWFILALDFFIADGWIHMVGVVALAVWYAFAFPREPGHGHD